MKKKRHRLFQVRAVGDLKRRYGFIADNRQPILLSKNNVPEQLWPLISHAEFWGISDDVIREDLAARVPEKMKRQLKALLQQYEDPLDKWLAGPEAASVKPSREYVAFSAMRMIADSF